MNCDPNFRDRVSNLEPVLARVQSTHAGTAVIVFVEKENLGKVDILRQRFEIFDALTYPLSMEEILGSLARATRNDRKPNNSNSRIFPEDSK